MNPPDRQYSKEHEWARAESEDHVTVGITRYAQEQLGDIVYLDLPPPGTAVEQFSKLGEIESVKAVSDIYSPVSGEVVEVNEEVAARPEVVNEDPFEKGWLLKLKVGSLEGELENLLTADQYDAFLESEAH